MWEKRRQLVYIKNNSGAIKTEKRFVRFGKRGSADFLCFFNGGRTYFLECKAPKGRQSEAQKDFQQRVEALGYQYMIIRQATEVYQLLKEHENE